MGETVAPVLEGFSIRRIRRARVGRRAFLVLLVVFLALGFANVFGVRTSTVSATESGYTLRVMYASVSRPGLVTPWSVEVRRPGGFMGPVTLAASSSYLEIFDGNGFGPDPSSVGTLGFWILVSSYLSFRWKRIRGLVEGIPTIVVRDGRISEEVLKVERLGEEEVLGAAREQGIASLSEIRFGILEGDGKFSFIKVHRDDQPGGAEKRSR